MLTVDLQCETVATINKVSFYLTKHIDDLEKLSRTVEAEGVATRELLVSLAEEQREAEEKATKKQKLLEALYFSDMMGKEQLMEGAYKSTFQWIFSKSQDSDTKWSDFGEWLSSSHGIYWIEGKPGSGKSTLMDFLWKHNETKSRLRKWNADWVGLKFFISDQGSPIQCSFSGLLQALILQLLSSCDYSDLLEQAAWKSLWNDFELECSYERLSTAFWDIIALVNKPICVFLDGLDEMAEDERELVTFVNRLGETPDVKLCVSSRPCVVFINAFRACPRLRLQDLTHNDIRTYVDCHLLKDSTVIGLAQRQASDARRLAGDIVRKADGVFIWVRLAIKALLRGLDQQDSWEELFRRLDTLPEVLGKLYRHMWNTFNEDEAVYKETTTHWLCNVAVPSNVRDPSVVGFAVAVESKLRTTLCTISTLPDLRQIYDRCVQIEAQIPARSRGFLEVRQPRSLCYQASHQGSIRGNICTACMSTSVNPPAIICEDADWQALRTLHRRTAVSFIHRTAVEFLQKAPDLGILPASSSSVRDVYVSVFQSKLGLRYLHLDPAFKWSARLPRDRGYTDTDPLLGLAVRMIKQPGSINYDFLRHIQRLYERQNALYHEKTTHTLEHVDENINRWPYNPPSLLETALKALYPLWKSEAAITILKAKAESAAAQLFHFILKTWGFSENANRYLRFLLENGLDPDTIYQGGGSKGLAVTLYYLYIRCAFASSEGSDRTNPRYSASYNFRTGTIQYKDNKTLDETMRKSRVTSLLETLQCFKDKSTDLEQRAVLTWDGCHVLELKAYDTIETRPKQLVVFCMPFAELGKRLADHYALNERFVNMCNADFPLLVLDCHTRSWWKPRKEEECQKLRDLIDTAHLGLVQAPSQLRKDNFDAVLNSMRPKGIVLAREDISRHLGLDRRHSSCEIEAFLKWSDEIFATDDLFPCCLSSCRGQAEPCFDNPKDFFKRLELSPMRSYKDFRGAAKVSAEVDDIKENIHKETEPGP